MHPRRVLTIMSQAPLHNPPTPVGLDELQHDVHAVNQEIDRLAFVMRIDLEDELQVHRLLYGPLSPEAHPGEHLDLLRGLLLLRGKIRQRRLNAGLPDGPSPIAEHIYPLLRIHEDDCTKPPTQS
ncbi:MAG: hypothetical protein RL357_333 [Pseudomonadota bacterium]|jgi:hypothetical protein